MNVACEINKMPQRCENRGVPRQRPRLILACTSDVIDQPPSGIEHKRALESDLRFLGIFITLCSMLGF
jgi:hypothetical protein